MKTIDLRKVRPYNEGEDNSPRFIQDPNQKQISYEDKVDYIKKKRNKLSSSVVGDNELDMMVYEINNNYIFHGYLYAESINKWYFEVINR